MGVHVLKATMTRGEVSPLAHARQDIELYQAAVARLRNFHVLREGGVRKRSGTRYRGSAKYANKDTRLIDFVFNGSDSYVLEFGDQYVRFWTKDGQVENLGSPYEVASQYTEADLRNIQWVQSGDVIFIAFRSMTKKPKTLTRIGPTNWQFADVEFRDGPYLPINDVSNAVSTSGAPTTGGTTTLTFGSTANINGGSGFQTTDVGRLIRVQFDGKWSWGVIASRISTTQITVTWSDGQGGTTASNSWRLGAFSDTTGYPGSVAVFQGRMVWASTPSNPRYIGYSRSGLVSVFSPSAVDGTVTDDNGGAYDIISGDQIIWLQEAPRLQIGMDRVIRSLGASDIDQQFGPRNIHVKVEVQEGVSSVRPAVVGPSTVHANTVNSAINDLFFDYQANSLVRPELSTLAEHLFDGVVREVIFQQMPYRRLWTVMNDGTLACTTLDRYEKVIGFAGHSVGGSVLSAAAIPGNGQDDLWLVVRRTVNNTQVQYIETFDPDFLRDDLEDAFFVDCGATYEGSATDTVSGIDWLLNTEVAILADGKVLPNTTVDGSGVLTLPNGRTASKISFGLPVVAECTLLPVPMTTSEGAVLGRKVKVVGVDIDLYETKGLVLVTDRGVMTEVKERPAAKQDEASLQVGMFRVLAEGDWRSAGVVGFKSDKPLPATVRAINVHVQTE